MSKKITGIALIMLAVSVAIAGYVSVTWADKFTKEDAFTVNFLVDVPAKNGDEPGKKTVTYTVEYKW